MRLGSNLNPLLLLNKLLVQLMPSLRESQSLDLYAVLVGGCPAVKDQVGNNTRESLLEAGVRKQL